MLNKLLANLPFNPGLMNQVSFYGKRIRQEGSIRRIGFAFVVLAMLIQLFAVLSPAQSTVADSNNDLIDGGIGSKAGAVVDCQNNLAGYQTILNNYGISCTNVANASTITLHSTDDSRQLFSMGRIAYGKAGETPATINNVTYFWRYLWSWDTGPASTYTALQLTNSSGKTFFILFNCGNLVSVGLPQAPALTISKTTFPGAPAANTNIPPNTTLGYRIFFSNTGGAAPNVVVNDPVPANTTFVWAGTGSATSFPTTPTQQPTWRYTSLGTANNYYVDLEVKVNPGVANGTKICNTATIGSSETATIASNQVCNTLVVPPVNTPVPPPTPLPKPTETPTPTPTPNIPTASCPYDTSIPVTSPQCKACVSSQTQTDVDACLTFSKGAANLTQSISNANGTTAQAGDVIQYTLSVDNTSKATAQKFVIQENLSDVLDYADVQDLNGGALDNMTGVLSWPGVDIPAGQTVSKTFTMKVKNPIPQTPPSSSDPGHFDHVMTNVYGNTININLPTPIIQAAAQTAQSSLPNTGPGSSLLIGGAVIVVVGYFVARARLLAKETDIVRRDVAIAGEV